MRKKHISKVAPRVSYGEETKLHKFACDPWITLGELAPTLVPIKDGQTC
jgi:hypothetical protein